MDQGNDTYPLTVLVHGTERGAQQYRDEFSDYGEGQPSILLAPLFPCGIEEPGETHNYKFIEYRGIRFDHVLLAMVDEVAELYRIESDRFLLHGFSGGGQFVHRFFYLHPGRLTGLSIGAPGLVTLLDSNMDWWVGTRGFEQRFGQSLDLDGLRGVPVQMVIGGDDTETRGLTVPESDQLWIEGANAAGATRLERLASLRGSFVRAGIEVRFDSVPGVAHDGWQLLEPVKSFFASALARTGAGVMPPMEPGYQP
jgi:pimeloyl-ACP methyl ester carboxylesterase